MYIQRISIYLWIVYLSICFFIIYLPTSMQSIYFGEYLYDFKA